MLADAWNRRLFCPPAELCSCLIYMLGIWWTKRRQSPAVSVAVKTLRRPDGVMANRGWPVIPPAQFRCAGLQVRFHSPSPPGKPWQIRLVKTLECSSHHGRGPHGKGSILYIIFKNKIPLQDFLFKNKKDFCLAHGSIMLDGAVQQTAKHWQEPPTTAVPGNAFRTACRLGGHL